MKGLILLSLTALFVLTQCASSSNQANQAAKPKYDTKLDSSGSFRKNGYWVGDNMSGTSRIRISISEQLAFFYKGDKLAGISPVSTGMGGWDTPEGTFRISQKSKKHNSSLYGVIVNKSTDQLVNGNADSRIDKPGAGEKYVGAPMNYFMRFAGAVGMHEGHLPGYAASHGCVRLPTHMVQKFFQHARIGTMVKVDP